MQRLSLTSLKDFSAERLLHPGTEPNWRHAVGLKRRGQPSERLAVFRPRFICFLERIAILCGVILPPAKRIRDRWSPRQTLKAGLRSRSGHDSGNPSFA